MPKTTVIITVDGLDPEYLELCDAPNLMALAKRGFHLTGSSMMPSVTNVNNVSIVTGEYPSEHGISSNYRMVRETGEEIYMESGEYILSETMFQRAERLGARTILSTSKDKLRTLLSDGASTAISSENAPDWVVAGVGAPPPIYSLEVNGWTIRAAAHAMKLHPADIVYISTTDFAMHTFGPSEPESQQHITILDDAIGDLVDAHPDVTLFLTADHGMSPKTRMVDLADVLARSGILRRWQCRSSRTATWSTTTTSAAVCSSIWTPVSRTACQTPLGYWKTRLGSSESIRERPRRGS